MKKMTRLIIPALVALLVSGPALTQTKTLSDVDRQKMSNLQHDASECSMFYQISAEGFRRNDSSGSVDAVATADKMSENMMVAAFLLGKKIGMKPEAMEARLQLSVEKLLDQIGNDYVNYSILLAKYQKRCNELYAAIGLTD